MDKRELVSRVNELVGSWSNGNRTFVVDELIGMPRKALVVFGCMLEYRGLSYAEDLDAIMTLLDNREPDNA